MRGASGYPCWRGLPGRNASQTYKPKLGACPSIEALTQSLQLSATITWEVLEAIHDSGASVSVILQQVRREWEVVPGEAALAGVRYEIADCNEIQSLKEIVMSIMTVDVSWRRL